MKMNKASAWFWVAMLSTTPAMASVIEETRSMAANGTVTVNNVAGEINFTPWDKNEVYLSGQLGNKLELIVTESSQGVRFEVRRIDDDNHFDESVLNFKVPAGASLVAEGVSSDITILGNRGASIHAETVSGDVEIEAETDRVDLRSVSGDIHFLGIASRASVESVSGDISLDGVHGELKVSTVSGDAEVTAGEVNIGKLDTVSGSLDLALSVTDGGRLTIESMSGDVELNLPSDQQGEFKAQSFSGRINSKFGEAKSEKYGPGSHLKHVSGASGAVIRAESFSGDIRIGHK